MGDERRHGSYREAFEARKKKVLITRAIIAVVILCLLVVVVRLIKYSDFIQSRQEKGSKILTKELEKDENFYSAKLDGYYFENVSDDNQIGKKLSMNNSDNNLTYNIAYPSIGDDTIDSAVSDHITTLAAEYMSDYATFDAAIYGVKASLNVDYHSYLAGDSVVSFVFFENYDAPGYSEPTEKVETFSYLLKTGDQISLEDMMKGNYLKVLSEKTKETLESDESFAESLSEKKYKKNYKAYSENFTLFAFSKSGLKLFFEPDRIAPSQLGVVTVNVDAGDLRDYMKYNAFKHVDIPVATSDPATAAPSADNPGGDPATSPAINPEENVDFPVAPADDNVDPSKPMVAFTFDDGPRAESTGKILDVLEKYDSRATFFLVGNRIDDYQDVVRREYELGCDVANHSYSHAKFSELKPEKIERQIENTNNKLKKILGVGASLVRTPYGETSSKVLKNVNYPVILWDIDTLDWKSRNSKKVVRKILNNVSDGDIILMHDIYDSTADAVAKVVPKLKKKGFQIVSVSQLFKYKGVTPEAHKTYFSVKSQ